MFPIARAAEPSHWSDAGPTFPIASGRAVRVCIVNSLPALLEAPGLLRNHPSGLWAFSGPSVTAVLSHILEITALHGDDRIQERQALVNKAASLIKRSLL